ncbi:hypothetical protein [Mesorhizobium amorphae]|uniref:Uncharacterized protein n=1 Tax=Mesorhizobium amorphae CCNWGS0123 TaxID=1082933 RepID=G6YJ01_9HYPH|nr:hypothetical protein A6B35_29795 [Mesorhizobium amorphae CCNWGS0123]EHH05505.1 hypothetical protein MEA186_29882 [Mesorhizobium amorphae CCNWGS0123]
MLRAIKPSTGQGKAVGAERIDDQEVARDRTYRGNKLVKVIEIPNVADQDRRPQQAGLVKDQRIVGRRRSPKQHGAVTKTAQRAAVERFQHGDKILAQDGFLLTGRGGVFVADTGEHGGDMPVLPVCG